MPKIKRQIRILKVRFKWFWQHRLTDFKALRNWQQLSLILVISLVLLVPTFALSNKTESIPDQEYYQIRLEKIKNTTDTIKTLTDVHKHEYAQNNLLNENIQKYQEALLDGYAACKELDVYYEQAKTAANNPATLIKNMARVKSFCTDFENVTDYARKVSKASEQLLLFRSDILSDNTVVNSLSTLEYILGYTKTDLAKLSSNPINDPALPELSVTIDRLQTQIADAKKNGSAEAYELLAKEVKEQQHNILNARTYYWNNTVDISNLLSSLESLSYQFKAI